MNVLIVDNNKATLSKLKDILISFGADYVQTAETAKDCEFKCSIHSFDLIIIDFLLPDNVSGEDFIRKLEIDNDTCTLWLTSSVVGESGVRELFESKDVGLFLKKPIKEDLVKEKFIDLKNKKKRKEDRIFSTFYEEDISLNELIQLVKDIPIINNYELALLYCLCSISKLTGSLCLKHEEKGQSVLSFFNGDLVSVRTPHKRSYFGVLLYEYGFSEIQDIKKYLNDKTNKRIGEKLINSGCISPHAVHHILKEQSRIRISQLLSSFEGAKVEIKKDPSISADDRYVLDLQDLRYLLAQTLRSKMDKVWVKNFLSLKGSFILNKTKHQQIFHAKDVSWMGEFKKIIDLIDGKKSLNNVIDKATDKYSIENEEALFILYYLLICKYIFMKDDNQTANNYSKNMKQKIMRFKERVETDDYFYFLGVSKDAHKNEIKDRINKMISTFHPDRCSTDLSTDLAQHCSDIVVHLNKIRETLLDLSKRKHYIEGLKKKTKSEYFYIISEYQKAKEHLNKGQYLPAVSMLEKIKDVNEAPADIILCYCWAFIKSRNSFDVAQNEKDKVFALINRVDLETRHTYLYHFVKALYLLKLKHFNLARSELKICRTMEPLFAPAMIELKSMEKQKSKFVDKFFKSG